MTENKGFYGTGDHVWDNWGNKPAVVLNWVGGNYYQIDCGNGPVFVHGTSITKFEDAWTWRDGRIISVRDIPTSHQFFQWIDMEVEARAEAARYKSENDPPKWVKK